MASLRSAVLLAVLGISAIACTHVRVEEAKGPDAGRWRRLSCSHLNEKCFKVANEICPNGYYFGRVGGGNFPAAKEEKEEGVTTLPPQENWSKGMYSRQPGSLLVKCADKNASNDD